MGRSSIRGSPVKVNSPLPNVSAAQSGRIAVPALPKNNVCATSLLSVPASPSTSQTVLLFDKR